MLWCTWHCAKDAAENKLSSLPALMFSFQASSLCLMCCLFLELSSSTSAQLDHKQLEVRGRIFSFDSFVVPNVLGAQQMFLGLNIELKTKFTLDGNHLFSAYIPRHVFPKLVC